MECAVISTCKRFEILITFESRKNMTDMIDIKNEIKDTKTINLGVYYLKDNIEI